MPPSQQSDADAAMRKLGQRLRDGWAKRHPVSAKSLESVRDVIRAKWDKALPPPPNDGRAYSQCPNCREWVAQEEMLHISVSLRGDALLGPDVPQRFHATKFDANGLGLDSKGAPCFDVACPHCHHKLPQVFSEKARALHLASELKPSNIKPRNAKKRQGE